VVPGVRFAPVIRANRLPPIQDLDPGGELPEPDRPAEVARFGAAAATVAERLRERAAAATGAAAEVLTATAQLAQDRAWLGSAENAIKAGKPVRRRDGAAFLVLEGGLRLWCFVFGVGDGGGRHAHKHGWRCVV